MIRAPRSAILVIFVLLAAAPLAAQQAAQPTPQQTAAPAPDFQAFSRFDFVPGEKVVGFEDFSQDSIGDFPAKWNTNAAGEIVTVAGKPGRWLKLTRAGDVHPRADAHAPRQLHAGVRSPGAARVQLRLPVQRQHRST